VYTERVTIYILGMFDWVDKLVDMVQQYAASKAVLAPLLLLFVEEAGIPLPIINGDMILAYTGYRLSLHPNGPGLWQAFLAAQVAALAGASILFFISRRWGQWLVLKLGKFIFLKEKHIKRAEGWFARFGALGIIVGRHIPGLRIPVTVFAATSGISYLTFIISTFISTSIWILFYLTLGKRIGITLHNEIARYAGFSIAVIVAIIALIIAIHVIGMYRERHADKLKAAQGRDAS